MSVFHSVDWPDPQDRVHWISSLLHAWADWARTSVSISDGAWRVKLRPIDGPRKSIHIPRAEYSLDADDLALGLKEDSCGACCVFFSECPKLTRIQISPQVLNLLANTRSSIVCSLTRRTRATWRPAGLAAPMDLQIRLGAGVSQRADPTVVRQSIYEAWSRADLRKDASLVGVGLRADGVYLRIWHNDSTETSAPFDIGARTIDGALRLLKQLGLEHGEDWVRDARLLCIADIGRNPTTVLLDWKAAEWMSARRESLELFAVT